MGKTENVFETYGRETIKRWASDLNIFQFTKVQFDKGAWRESFRLGISFNTKKELDNIFALLDIPVVYLNKEEISPENSWSVSQAVEGLVNPGRVTLFGCVAAIEVCQFEKYGKHILIQVFDPKLGFEVSEIAYKNAKHIEAKILLLNLNAFSFNWGKESCVSKENYPEFWAS